MRAERIKYPMGALTAEGALIYDENVLGRRPAVLVAPNWMGMTDKAIQRGELVAGNRYVVFVADMYGAGTRGRFRRGGRLGQPVARGRH
jgi:dienelactone hydrolase